MGDSNEMAMQLEDFAKQVLFGTTLEDKLGFPREEIVDTRRGDPIKTPGRLSRPDHLCLRDDGVRANHPADAKLVDERERGRLLHFFANHELLATELMALAILKFPDAPASFRRGLLETLKDEQIHTQMYMHRMKQCGVEFGELPLSDYFWKSVSSMEDPLDYVTRLSLTFEQANLDYSRDYAKLFDQVGDRPTGAILDKIYRDEIDHVGFGLKWFRRWKAEGKTDWEAYRERLVFPLSPARAKGASFNRDGREEVGLDAAFIEQLQVFRQSRGRTPYVYWFNGDAEAYALRGEFSAEQASVVKGDLSFLPAYLSRRDDILITAQRPSRSFLQSIDASGFELPELHFEDEKRRPFAPVIDRKIRGLKPWAWSPESVSFFRDTFGSLTRPVELESLWNEGRRELFSKVWSAQFGRELASEEETDHWLAPSEVYGRELKEIGELDDIRASLKTKGYANVVLKAPFSASAQGMRCLLAGEPLEGGVERWAEGILREQGRLVVEPWLDRVFDFSAQLTVSDGQLRVMGYTRLVNNARGQFRGIVTNAFCKGLDSELVRFLMSRVDSRPRVYHWFENRLVPALAGALQSKGFTGPLGVDAMVYRDPEGRLRLKPVVELNPRYTMGRVGHEIGKRNAANSAGFFQILNTRQIKRLGMSGFVEYAQNLSERYPLSFSDERKPRIVEGSLALTDPALAKRFLAVYHVRRSFEELPI